MAQYLRSQATVCGVRGYVLLPDDFTLPDGLSWSYQTNDWETNTYGPQAWSAMEATGAVFLPASGFRFGTAVYDVGSNGYFWTVSHFSHYNASSISVYYDGGYMYGDSRCLGRSVRLVQDL